MDRRSVLSLIAGGAVGTMVTPIPWKLTDDLSIWTQNWFWIPKNIPGENVYVSATSKLCPSACGIKVRTVNGRPVTIVGDEEHPLGGGGVSPLAAAEVQLLYSPSRIKRPMARGLDGGYAAITWAEAMALLEKKVGAVKGMNGKIACLSGDTTGAINEVLSGFAAGAGSSACYAMPCEMQTAAQAWNGVMGGSGQVGYDLENSDYVLALGADVLESWGPVVRNRDAYSKARPAGETPKTTYVYAGPVENGTGAGADQWIPIKPGTEGYFAMGLAYYLLQAGKGVDGVDDKAFAVYKKMVLAQFSPKDVAKVTGVDAAVIAKAAKELMQANKPLVITGSAFGQGGSPAAVAAGLGVNLLLGRLNKSGGMTVVATPTPVVNGAATREAIMAGDFVGYLADVAAGKKPIPEVLVTYDANPYYALPQADAWAGVMDKAAFKVAFSAFMDETAMAADLVLPIPLGIERYDDVDTPYGCARQTYCLNQPATEPVFNSRNAGDVLLALAGALGIDLGFATFQEVLEAKGSAAGIGYGETAISDDMVFASFDMGTAAIAQGLAGSGADGIALAPLHYLRMGAQNVAMSPFALKAIRDTELVGNDSFVTMNGATAAKLGKREGDMATLSNDGGSIQVRVHIMENVMDGVVAAPLGFGHTAYDAYAKGKGANVSKLLTARFEAGTGMAVWTDATVKIA